MPEYLTEINNILNSLGKDKVNLEDDLTKDSILDSIELIDFLINVEKKYNVKISENSIYESNLSNINNLIKYLETNGK
jgi:acyl carrier protein